MITCQEACLANQQAIDDCLAPDLRLLWESHRATCAACQGHYMGLKRVVLAFAAQPLVTHEINLLARLGLDGPDSERPATEETSNPTVVALPVRRGTPEAQAPVAAVPPAFVAVPVSLRNAKPKRVVLPLSYFGGLVAAALVVVAGVALRPIAPPLASSPVPVVVALAADEGVGDVILSWFDPEADPVDVFATSW